MTYREKAIQFSCVGETLLGVVALPVAPAHTGVVIVVGGPQTRVGSHRQFVLLSRALSKAGYAVLRFDYRGMGDSTGAQRNFEGVSDDIGAAIDALQAYAPGLTRIALWGLCDAASAALLYCAATGDKRVTGLCLLNPWVRSEAGLAQTHVKHYYPQRLIQMDFWRKVLKGQVSLRAVPEFFRTLLLSSKKVSPSSGALLNYQQRMATAWHAFSGSLMLTLSANDYTAKEFLEITKGDPYWKSALNHPRLTRHDLHGADHTFSNASSRERVERLTLDWLTTLNGQPKPSNVT